MQLLDDTPAILLLHQLCSKRGYSFEWKTAKLHDWPIMGTQVLAWWTTSYFSLDQDCHRIPAAVCLQHRDQRIRLIIPENWEHYQIQWRLEVISMFARKRCWQILTSRPQGTVNQQTRRTRKIQLKAFLFGLQPFTVNPEDLELSARTFLWNRELRFGGWCFKSGDTKTEA